MRYYAGFASLSAAILGLLACSWAAASFAAYGIAAALLVVALVLCCHLPDSWYRARCRARSIGGADASVPRMLVSLIVLAALCASGLYIALSRSGGSRG